MVDAAKIPTIEETDRGRRNTTPENNITRFAISFARYLD
jgi:hypothetical protein